MDGTGPGARDLLRDEHLDAARAAQRAWAGMPVGRRLETVKCLRRRIAGCASDLVAALAALVRGMAHRK